MIRDAMVFRGDNIRIPKRLCGLSRSESKGMQAFCCRDPVVCCLEQSTAEVHMGYMCAL